MLGLGVGSGVCTVQKSLESPPQCIKTCMYVCVFVKNVIIIKQAATVVDLIQNV